MLSLSLCNNRGPSPSPSNLVSRVLIYTCIHHSSAEGARAPTARRHATGTGCGRGQACALGAQLTWTPGEPSIPSFTFSCSTQSCPPSKAMCRAGQCCCLMCCHAHARAALVPKSMCVHIAYCHQSRYTHQDSSRALLGTW